MLQASLLLALVYLEVGCLVCLVVVWLALSSRLHLLDLLRLWLRRELLSQDLLQQL